MLIYTYVIMVNLISIQFSKSQDCIRKGWTTPPPSDTKSEVSELWPMLMPLQATLRVAPEWWKSRDVTPKSLSYDFTICFDFLHTIKLY